MVHQVELHVAGGKIESDSGNTAAAPNVHQDAGCLSGQNPITARLAGRGCRSANHRKGNAARAFADRIEMVGVGIVIGHAREIDVRRSVRKILGQDRRGIATVLTNLLRIADFAIAVAHDVHTVRRTSHQRRMLHINHRVCVDAPAEAVESKVFRP